MNNFDLTIEKDYSFDENYRKNINKNYNLGRPHAALLFIFLFLFGSF
jgi:hypothetical protein